MAPTASLLLPSRTQHQAMQRDKVSQGLTVIAAVQAEFLLTDLVCSGRGAITGGGAASSSSSSSSDTEGTAGVSETAFTFCMELRK